MPQDARKPSPPRTLPQRLAERLRPSHGVWPLPRPKASTFVVRVVDCPDCRPGGLCRWCNSAGVKVIGVHEAP